MDVSATISALALLFSVVQLAGMVLIRYNMMQTAAVTREAEARIESKIKEHGEVILEKFEREARGFGETISAMRTQTGFEVGKLRDHIHQLELHVRDNYQRRDSFAVIIGEMRSEVRTSISEVKEEIKTIENKIDRLHERMTNGGGG